MGAGIALQSDGILLWPTGLVSPTETNRCNGRGARSHILNGERGQRAARAIDAVGLHSGLRFVPAPSQPLRGSPSPVSTGEGWGGGRHHGSISPVASRELEDHLIDREAVAGLRAQFGDRAVALGAQHVLHLHRLDDGERLAGLDLLTFLDDQRRE